MSLIQKLIGEDYYMTETAAQSAVATKNAARRNAGRSSGHARIDHVVKPGPGKVFRRYKVTERSV